MSKLIFLRRSVLILIFGIVACTTTSFAQSSRDLVRVEKKVNQATDQAQRNKDSIMVIRENMDAQYLEMQDIRISTDSMSAGLKSDMKAIKDQLGMVDEKNVNTKTNLDRFWLLIAAALVFLMQAGFKSLEVGMLRDVHGTGIGLKNLVDFVVVAVIYFIVGFSLMFGFSKNGFIGSGLWMPIASELEQFFNEGTTSFGMEFFIFQMAFAATAATIVSGAMSERTALVPYLLTAGFVAGFIYPIVGHMAWGNLFLTDGKAWLADLGFIDFAGSTVVHSTGAWVALIGVWIIGPRLGRFRLDGTLNEEKFKASSLGYSILGVFLLWFGWWGFNGGSTLAFDVNVAAIINNTNLAGAFGALAAMIHAYIWDKEHITEKLIGGALAGLVAVTAPAAVVDSIGAMAIGLIGGILHNIGYDLLIKFKLDDPVGAIPVHGVAGFWGTIAVGIFGKEEMIRTYLGMSPDAEFHRLDQIVTQLLGSGIVLVFVCVSSFLFFKLLDVVLGLRVDPEKENSGYIFVSAKRDKAA